MCVRAVRFVLEFYRRLQSGGVRQRDGIVDEPPAMVPAALKAVAPQGMLALGSTDVRHYRDSCLYHRLHGHPQFSLLGRALFQEAHACCHGLLHGHLVAAEQQVCNHK